MLATKNYKFWFCTGSQDLYGDECLAHVAEHSKIIVAKLNESGVLPYEVVWKPTLITNELIRKTFNEANVDEECAGVITWMHTFSPAKSWILGLQEYRKPLLHLHTQFNEEIPYDTIDMDFMNENQSAHGDREYGHIVTRMGIERKVVVGHWSDVNVQERIASWMRTAVGVIESSHIRVMRVADNMRNVAVTEGDKVEAQLKFGWEVDTYPVNEIAEAVAAVSESDTNALVDEYYDKYDILLEGRDPQEFRRHVAVQAQIEIGFERFLDEKNYQAIVTHFGDLGALKQLPGLAMQRGLTYGSLTTIIIENMKLERDEKISALKEKEMQSETIEDVEKQLKGEEVPKEQEPPKEMGFISVSIGDGINEIFQGLGVDYIIEGGQTMNPSTEDMLNAIEKVNAKNIFILPNNKNIILAANQAASLVEDKKIIVIPTKTIPQGITALINYIPDSTPEENAERMSEELGTVKTGQVTYAVRDTVIDDKEIKQDDFMGIGDQGILSVGKELETTVLDMIEQLIDEDSAIVSIYYGEDAREDAANAIGEKITEAHPDVEVEVHYGGQPIYYYVISVE